VAEARDLRLSNYTKSLDRCVFLFMLDQFFFCNRRMCVNNMEDKDMMIIVLMLACGAHPILAGEN